MMDVRTANGFLGRAGLVVEAVGGGGVMSLQETPGMSSCM